MVHPLLLIAVSFEDSINIVAILTYLSIGSVMLLLGLVYGSRCVCLSPMMLSMKQTVEQGYIAPNYLPTLVGQQGMAQTPLRPAGKVMIQGIRYDAKTTGCYIALGTAVVVTSVAGISLTVQAVDQA